MADNTKKNSAAALSDKPTDAAVEKSEKPASVSDVKETKAKNTEAAAETKTAKSSDKSVLDEIDDGDLILEDIRESVRLTPENARFIRSNGGLVSLDLHIEGKEPESFERIVLLRAFPLTNPSEFISVRTPASKKEGKGVEIGMVRRMSDFDEETNMLLNEELDRRYFTPLIQKIHSVKEKFGYTYWDADTTAGRITFILGDIFNAVRLKDDGSVMINDIDGNVFSITDPSKLDPASYKKIEIYL